MRQCWAQHQKDRPNSRDIISRLLEMQDVLSLSHSDEESKTRTVPSKAETQPDASSLTGKPQVSRGESITDLLSDATPAPSYLTSSSSSSSSSSASTGLSSGSTEPLPDSDEKSKTHFHTVPSKTETQPDTSTASSLTGKPQVLLSDAPASSYLTVSPSSSASTVTQEKEVQNKDSETVQHS